jgi:hypothetical protein
LRPPPGPLLLELDEGIYRAVATTTPGGYPGLYILLDKLTEIALDESWADFLNWLLAGPWGANLRHGIAHGLPAPLTAEYAALVLRAVTMLGIVAGPAPGPRQSRAPTVPRPGARTRRRRSTRSANTGV